MTPLLLALTILPIPDREQHAQSPPSGWCGETAIQEALLHFGVWASQKTIHAAGKSKHPDLYSDEIPTALAALGIRYDQHDPKVTYEAWVQKAIDAGDPVFAGVKILPTEHPTWGLDHFVLVVGHGPDGLLVNTTWGKRVWASAATTKGISFVRAFYGLRLKGTDLAWTPRLEVVAESPFAVKLRARCAGAATRLERRPSPGAQPVWTDVLAKGETTVGLSAEETGYFHCLP